MELKDLTLHKVFLSGRAHKICKLILAATDKKRADQSYREIISRVTMDYTKENVVNKEERLLRMYFLYLSLKDSMVWNKGVATNVYFRKPSMLLIRQFQQFAKERDAFISVPEIPNVIIHDYIACVELRGIDFIEYYITNHNKITQSV